MALHWKILIGLVVGVVVGIIINIAWDAETWSGLGVEEPAAFLEGQQSRAVLPDGFDRVEDLDPANPNLRGKTVDTVTMAQIERYGLETVEINPDSEFLAHAALFLRNLNDFVGDLFMRGLRFIAVPIVLFSLIVGGASLGDLNKLGRVGGKTVGLYMLTTAFAITLGLGLANIVGPGRGIDQTFVDQLIAATQADVEARVGQAAERPSPWQVALDVIPPNPFGALAAAEMLQVVMTGLLIGLALTKLPESKSRPVVAFFDAMTNVIIEVVHWVLKIAPVAVFALICGVVAELGLDVLGKLLAYSLTLIAGLLIMMFGIYPIFLKLFTPIAYRRFFKAISPAQLLAFSSSSSGATMPVTMQCCEERLGISEEVTSFVIPLGATINMDGTAMYQGVAAVFIAQLFGQDLTFADNLTILVTATLASVGTAAVPSAGVIMLVIVLQQVNLPLAGIGVILGVDRILDMMRTSCNITGDCMVTSVVAAGENAIGPPPRTEPPMPGETPDAPTNGSPPPTESQPEPAPEPAPADHPQVSGLPDLPETGERPPAISPGVPQEPSRRERDP